MRRGLAVVLLGAAASVGSTAQPPRDKDGALLKAVAPPAGQSRVRVPLAEGPMKAIQLRVQVPHPRKKGEATDATAGLDTLNRCVVTTKMLETWGYPTPAGKTFVLPELLVVAHQLAPKPAGKGTDVLVRVQNLKFDVLDAAPDGGGQILGADMLLFLPDLVRATAGRPPETRFHFPEKFLDLTVPPAAVRWPGTGEDLPAAAEPEAKADPNLVVVACPLNPTPSMAFTSGSVDGIDTFQTPDGKTHAVTPLLSSVTHGGSGVIMNIGMARALKLDVDLTKEAAVGMSTEKRLRLIEHTVKELRVGALTGPGLKTPRELVFADQKIWIEVTESEPALWIGYPFLVAHFKDSVLAYAADGKATLHGRVNPDLVKDPRPKKK
jgi:hypothetical protein